MPRPVPLQLQDAVGSLLEGDMPIKRLLLLLDLARQVRRAAGWAGLGRPYACFGGWVGMVRIGGGGEPGAPLFP